MPGTTTLDEAIRQRIRNAFGQGEYVRTVYIAQTLGNAAILDEEVSDSFLVALERSGKRKIALELIKQVLALRPRDRVAVEVRQRLANFGEDRELRAADPLITVRRAEAYAEAGEVGRAIRCYRVLLAENPRNKGLSARLFGLIQERDGQESGDPFDEELTEPLILDLDVPNAGVAGASEQSNRVRAELKRRADKRRTEEESENGKKTRRSLLRK